MATATDIRALLQVLRGSQWHVAGRVVETQDTSSRGPRERRLDVRGRLRARDALHAATPDELRDRIDELELDADVGCDVDFVVEASEELRAYDLRADASDVRVVEPGVVTVLVSLAAFHDDARAALGTLAGAWPALSAQGVRVVALALDEDPTRPRLRVKDVPFPVLWAGREGFASPAALALNVEDACPIAYLFDANGVCTCTGSVEEVLLSFAVRMSTTATLPQDLDNDGDDGNNNNDDDEEEKRKPSVVVPVHMWDGVCAKIKLLESAGTAMLTAILRSQTTYWCDSSSRRVERIAVAGDVFPEGRAEVEAWISREEQTGHAWVSFRGVQFVTRAKPLNFAAACASCRVPVDRESLYYGCLVDSDTLCSRCGKAHAAKHPLVVLGSGRTNLTLSTYGVGHVVECEDEGDDSNVHFDIGCDACGTPLGSSLRYKNLAREDHDLCQGCFRMLREIGTKMPASSSPLAPAKSFIEKFGCSVADPFAEMKTSRTVGFSRLDRGPRPIPAAQPAEMATPIPCGHTRFSWVPPPPPTTVNHDDYVGVGHTHYSWTHHL